MALHLKYLTCMRSVRIFVVAGQSERAATIIVVAQLSATIQELLHTSYTFYSFPF